MSSEFVLFGANPETMDGGDGGVWAAREAHIDKRYEEIRVFDQFM